MTYQEGLYCNKCTTLASVCVLGEGMDIDNGEVMQCKGEGIWEISVPSSHFCCEPKTSLKKLSLLKIHLQITSLVNQKTSKQQGVVQLFHHSCCFWISSV